MEKQFTNDWTATTKRLEELNERLLTPLDAAGYVPDPAIPVLKYDETFGDQGKMVFRTPAKLLTIATSIIAAHETTSKFWVTMYETYLPPSNPPNYAALARITATGEMDLRFGPNKDGFAQVKFDDENYTTLESMHELTDGKTIVFGELVERNDTSTYRKPMIIKLLADGVKDESFGESGVVDVGQALKQPVEGALYAADKQDRILVLAIIEKGGYPNSLLTRLTAEGDLDQTFEGVWIQQEGDLSAAPLDMVLNNDDGKIIIAFRNPAGDHLICFDSEGKIDRNFGEDGFVDLSNAFMDFGSCSFTQGSNHLFLSGNYYDGGKFISAALANYTTDGVPEPIFNGGKPAHSNFGKGFPFRVWHRASERSHNPYTIKVLGWYQQSGGESYQVVGQYTSDGKPDLSFIEGHAIGHPPVEDYFTIGKTFIGDTSTRSLVAGRSSGNATIFAVKG
jgi:hypothetical protein